MMYLKTYESYMSDIESEIREILSELTDDGEFKVTIRPYEKRENEDSPQPLTIILEKYRHLFNDKLDPERARRFTWGEVKGTAQMLVSSLKDRYPVAMVEAHVRHGQEGSVVCYFPSIPMTVKDGEIYDSQLKGNEKVLTSITFFFTP